MSKILFISLPAFGHLNPLLSIALQMRTEGHQVQFLVPGNAAITCDRVPFQPFAAIHRTLQSHGIAAHLLPMPLPLLAKALWQKGRIQRLSGYCETEGMLGMMPLGLQHFTQQTLQKLEQIQPDAIVSDCAFLASHLAAEIANIPCAVVYQLGLSFRGDSVPPFGSGLPIRRDYATQWPELVRKERAVLQRLDRRVNQVRRHLGLTEFPSAFWRQPYSRWLNLVATTEAVEAPRNNLTETTFFIGPCFGNRRGQGCDFPFEQLRRDRYKVYVSLGTVFNYRPQVYRKIIAALDRPEYQVIVSAGASYDRLAHQGVPVNTMLFRSVPQVDLLPQVDLVITHGGNNTTNETLAAGKPAIAIPIGGEQGDNASRIEYLQAGLQLSLQQFDESDVLAAVQMIQSDFAFTLRAAALQRALARTHGPETAAALIGQLAATQQPVTRPAHSPVTVMHPHEIEALAV